MKLCFDVSIDSCFFTNGNFTSWKVAFCFRRKTVPFKIWGKVSTQIYDILVHL